MLPDPTLPASLLAVLANLRGGFTTPSFATFVALATGLIANTGKGTVTGMLTGAGLARHWSHDRAHKFFSRAAWSGDTLGMYLSRLIVRRLLPDGAAITVAVDDTLFKKRGKKVFGAGWQHDGAARGKDGVGFGVCFVVVGIIVELPFLTRPVCLPGAVRLWRPKVGPSKVEIAADLVKLLAAWHRDRKIHVVADACTVPKLAYMGADQLVRRVGQAARWYSWMVVPLTCRPRICPSIGMTSAMSASGGVWSRA